jgi:hypothetical protein
MFLFVGIVYEGMLKEPKRKNTSSQSDHSIQYMKNYSLICVDKSIERVTK